VRDCWVRSFPDNFTKKTSKEAMVEHHEDFLGSEWSNHLKAGGHFLDL
jgi:hypothetical protein